MAPPNPQDPRYKYLYGEQDDQSPTGQPNRYSGSTRFGQAQQQPRIPQMPAGLEPNPAGPMARRPGHLPAFSNEDYWGSDNPAWLMQTLNSQLRNPANWAGTPAAYDLNATAPEGYQFNPEVNDYVPILPTTGFIERYMNSDTREGVIVRMIVEGGMTPEEAFERYVDEVGAEMVMDDDDVPTGEMVVRDRDGNVVDAFSGDDVASVTEQVIDELGDHSELLTQPRPPTVWESELGVADPAIQYGAEDFYNESTVRQLEAADRAAEEAARVQAEKDAILARVADRYMGDGLQASYEMKHARGADAEQRDHDLVSQMRGDYMGPYVPEAAAVELAERNLSAPSPTYANPERAEFINAAVDSRQATNEAVRRKHMAIAADQRAQMAAEFAAAQGRTPHTDQMAAREAAMRQMLGLY